MTSPKSLNMQTLCSHHRGILPLLLDISDALSISPITPLPTPSKSDSLVSLSTLQPSQHPNMPKKVLKFTDPNPLSQGMITAMEWRKEQLLRARKRWDQRNAQRIKEGHLPMTDHSHALRDYADSATDPSSIVMDTPLPSHSPSDRENQLEAQLLHPPHPDAWSRLKTEVASPNRWLETLSTPSSNTTSRWKTTPPLSGKTTKIPLRFRRPTLPKGWVYEADVEEGGEVIKDEERDQCQSSKSTRSNHRRRPSMLEEGRNSKHHPYRTSGPVATADRLRTQSGDRLCPLQYHRSPRPRSTSAVYPSPHERRQSLCRWSHVRRG